jgi:hypothetical protein
LPSIDDPFSRACATATDCHDRLAAERQRVFRRINELAAAHPDDFTWVDLADAILRPEQLLGGDDDV